ncbi:hypothetical protein Goklo_022261, partial [Gossypium klotzschianum]|nr:hypothetical protein [Gossypium klotzschianum]
MEINLLDLNVKDTGLLTMFTNPEVRPVHWSDG